MVPFVDFALEIPIIIMLEDPENRSEGENFLLAYERVRGIQSNLLGSQRNVERKIPLKALEEYNYMQNAVQYHIERR